tara:strand:- start:686 stop:1126 length:441 start_codon:yes stop_codon:yes gene_type:complete
MNNYELILILNPDLSSKFDDFQTNFEKILSNLKFKVNKLENIGRRQLAYSIFNHNKGHYSIFQIEGPSEAALELESKLKYDNSVIRHLLLKVTSSSLEDSLLIVESKEFKKATQEEEQPKDKPKSASVESKINASNENATEKKSKD